MGILVPTAAVLLLLCFAFALYSAKCLLKNYAMARRIGVPVRIIFADPINPLWMIMSQRVTSIIRRLPFGLGDNNITKYNYLGWEYHLRTKAHQEMGDVFILCSPTRLWLYLGSAELISAVMRRSNDFLHDTEQAAMLGCFGPNMATVQGREWQKIRKLVGSCFNDTSHNLVWREALSQAQDLSHYWGSQTSVNTTSADIRMLFFNVILYFGSGKQYPFRGSGHTQIKPGEVSYPYKEALQTILENSLLILVLGTKFLAKPWLPRPLKRLHRACTTFQTYMTEAYEAEKSHTMEKATQQSLMTSLVRASEENTGGLTESEIYGNMFLVTVGGHDATTHTFTWVIFFLAGNPDVQDWIHEEISQVLGDRSPSDWNYKTDFPRLKRCLAVLFETLRLYSPIGVAKSTGQNSVTLQFGDKTLLIPPGTVILPNHVSVHTDTRVWGSESLTWRPSRWIRSDAHNRDNEMFIPPIRGSFNGWADGPRDCPGEKLSQVDSVAVIALLFKSWTVNPVAKDGESVNEARERVRRFIVEDTGSILMTQMLHPERCPLVWTKR